MYFFLVLKYKTSYFLRQSISRSFDGFMGLDAWYPFLVITVTDVGFEEAIC